MRDRRSRASRPATEWAVRSLLAAGAIGLGYASVVPTLADYLRKSHVQLAHVLDRGDGRITASLAASLAGPDATSADRAQADRLAKLALLQDPTAIAAASTLGINAQFRGDTNAARRLFAYSEMLSRRDMQTQLWAIEDSVARGNVVGALNHYDIALRTSPNAPDLLFPILAGAIEDSDVRTALIAKLLARPAWGGAFVDYVAGKGPNADVIADLINRLLSAHFPVSENASRAAIDGLIESGQPEKAWSYYVRMRGGVAQDRFRNPSFVSELSSPTLFDWKLKSDSGFVVSIQNGLFDFSGPGSASGSVLERVQMFSPGRYRLEGHSIGIADQPGNSKPYWALVCRANGLELGRVLVPGSDQNNGIFVGYFEIPAGCDTQVLKLMVQAAGGFEGTSGQIDQVTLSRETGGGQANLKGKALAN